MKILTREHTDKRTDSVHLESAPSGNGTPACFSWGFYDRCVLATPTDDGESVNLEPVPQPLRASLFLRDSWLVPGVLES